MGALYHAGSDGEGPMPLLQAAQGIAAAPATQGEGTAEILPGSMMEAKATSRVRHLLALAVHRHILQPSLLAVVKARVETCGALLGCW